MKATLYHYSHCPFCIRVRMAAGFLEINYETKLLRYDDEETPVKFCQKKMLPIWVDENGKSTNESLDIIALIDKKNKLDTQKTLNTSEWKSFEDNLNKASSPLHNLAMPYFIYTKEFDEKSAEYFQKKKEVKRGPFKELVKKHDVFEKELQGYLNAFEKNIDGFYNSKTLTLYDIVLASHLWALYIVPEFQFSLKLHSYLQKVKKECRFNYQEDLWQ